jgi:transcriptional regulator with XRE-family HTH domain
MEILSTGEKIKRARVYKGITLKELCGDKISISKMSCIENGKIKVDSDTLQYIARRLDVDYNYLVQDVYDQLEVNLKLLRSNSVEQDRIEEFIKYNLEYALEYSYYDFAFELIHKIFSYYVIENKIENIQLIISQYYELFQKTDLESNILVYYNDMATFFMKIKEYNEALTYYSRIRKLLEKQGIKDKEQYAYICFYEGICYQELNKINEAYTHLNKAIDYVSYINSNKDKGEFYHVFATLNILLNKVETDKYLNKAIEYLKDDLVALANSKGKNGNCYFKVNETRKAIKEIKEGLEIFPKENKKEYVDFLISAISTLYSNKELDIAFELTDEALDLSILFDDVRLIERAYYYKGMIFQRRQKYIEAEMYMNLSTDSLLRFASKEERYKRYNEMAELYYNLGELKESVKYFTLAMNIEKKI